MGDAMRVKEVKDGSDEKHGEEKLEGEGGEAKEEEGDDDEDKKKKRTEDDGGEVDYKKSSGFAKHVKSKNTGKSSSKASVFARTKSIREQREFLPAYSVRESLLQTIRENNIVIVVGETG